MDLRVNLPSTMLNRSIYHHTNFWCLWLPLLCLALQFLVEAFVPEPLYTRLHTENGPVEILQCVVLLPALLAALRLLLTLRFQPPVWLSVWALVAVMGCFYVTGEEISWGQHSLNWNTPEYWTGINDQNETNFHNTSSWLDQKPRLLLELGVIIGGLLMPLSRRIRKKDFPAWLEIIAPSSHLIPVAAIVLFIKIADKVGGATHIVLFGRASEVVEFFIYYFVWLYLVFLAQKALTALDKPSVTPTSV